MFFSDTEIQYYFFYMLWIHERPTPIEHTFVTEKFWYITEAKNKFGFYT